LRFTIAISQPHPVSNRCSQIRSDSIRTRFRLECWREQAVHVNTRSRFPCQLAQKAPRLAGFEQSVSQMWPDDNGIAKARADVVEMFFGQISHDFCG
jgi:hypothetical protein